MPVIFSIMFSTVLSAQEPDYDIARMEYLSGRYEEALFDAMIASQELKNSELANHAMNRIKSLKTDLFFEESQKK